MNKEELEKEAIKRVDAFIDNLSQDVKSTLYSKLNQEDVKNFLYGLYIDSAAPRENQIAELKHNNEILTNVINNVHIVRIKQLEKENAELKCECRRCIYTDCPRVPSDYEKDRNGICDHFKDVFDEVEKLKIKLNALEGQTPWKDINDKSELIKKIADLETRNQELLESCEGATMMYKDLQRATGIIKALLHALKKEDSDYTFALKNIHPILVMAEQFIEDGEVKK